MLAGPKLAAQQPGSCAGSRGKSQATTAVGTWWDGWIGVRARLLHPYTWVGLGSSTSQSRLLFSRTSQHLFPLSVRPYPSLPRGAGKSRILLTSPPRAPSQRTAVHDGPRRTDRQRELPLRKAACTGLGQKRESEEEKSTLLRKGRAVQPTPGLPSPGASSRHSGEEEGWQLVQRAGRIPA